MKTKNKEEKTWRKGILGTLDNLSSNIYVKSLIYSLSIIFFVTIILLPPIFGIILKRNTVVEIYANPSLLDRAHSAIMWSFIIAFTVSILDLIAGLPLAWFIVRSKSKAINIIDTLADVPFLIPTAALGYSTMLFWSRPGGISSLFGGNIFISPGVTLILLLHFTFSFPVIVRVMVGELLGYKEIYEHAARTLGAQPFTAVRTITIPLLKPALIASFLLSFSRSLSETGATVMVAGAFENGPVFIRNMKELGFEGPLVYVSSILIATSIIVFFLIRSLGPKLRFPIRRAWPQLERKLSMPASIKMRDGVTLSIFFFFVIIPSLFVSLPLTSALFDGTLNMALSGSGPWREFWQSVMLSYSIGFIATVINIVTGLPIALAIARKKFGKLTSILDALVNIPIVVPSVALGVSLSFFWGSFGFIPEFWLLVLSHTTITYTYFIRSMSAAIESIPQDVEEVASTLGAKPFMIFRRITVPLTKYSIFSGSVLVFTRSVGETGATLAVSKTLKTAPVLIVDWVKGVIPVSQSTQALGIGFLILASFLTLIIIRIVMRGK